MTMRQITNFGRVWAILASGLAVAPEPEAVVSRECEVDIGVSFAAQQDPSVEPGIYLVERYGGSASFDLLKLLLEEAPSDSRAVIEAAMIGYSQERADTLIRIQERASQILSDEQADALTVSEQSENKARIVRIAWEIDALNRRWLDTAKSALDEDDAMSIQRAFWRKSYPDMFARSPMDIVLEWIDRTGLSQGTVAVIAMEYRSATTAANDRLGIALDRRITVDAAIGLLVGDQRVRERMAGLDAGIDAVLLERRSVEKQACDGIRVEIENDIQLPENIALLLSW
jgi:hypothetical protein